MAGHRLENPTTAEVLTNYETRHGAIFRKQGRVQRAN
jgi:hypothetical protein